MRAIVRCIAGVALALSVAGCNAIEAQYIRQGIGTNIAWADGHITSERFEWTWPEPNAYAADNKRFLLGFFGPQDNRLFARD